MYSYVMRLWLNIIGKRGEIELVPYLPRYRKGCCLVLMYEGLS